MAEKHYGVTLQETREARGLSQKKLAMLADVSRATLALAEQGANIELDTLRKLTATLGITEIDIGGVNLRTTAAPGVSPSALAPLADEMERQAVQTRHIAARLRIIATVGVGKSISNDTPSGEGVTAKATQLAELVYNFARQVQTETDPKRLKRIEKDVSGLLHRSTA